MEWLIALVALTAMEIVLGIDNIVFIAVVTGRLPAAERPTARRLGLILALVMRIMLLCGIKWVMSLNEPVFQITALGIPASWFGEMDPEHAAEVLGVSWKDIILLVGGLFLISKSVREIHEKIDPHESDHQVEGKAGLSQVLMQIVVLDIVFSLDSVITAVGMAEQLSVMITAIIVAVSVMLLFANRVSEFVSRNPTLTMLALSFLILIGVMLVAEGIGTHVNKGYIYFAMAFSLVVEMLNMRMRKATTGRGAGARLEKV